MRVLIAPDKFKGTLTAREAARAIARGWQHARPADELALLPISDGGDGFGTVLAGLRHAERVRTTTVDAAGRRCVAGWWWEAGSRTAIIESSRIIGLAQLSPGRFHPFDLDTRGLAAVLRAAAKRGARRCVVGIGGSSTNDAGFGLACGLGWRFVDRAGKAIECWTGLKKLARLEPPHDRVWPRQIVVAVDVRSPMLGLRGCTRIYGPQKGLRPKDFALAEACLGRLARVIRITLGRDIAKEPGAGAAGGLGFGLVSFVDARLESGFEMVALAMKLNRQLRWADLVITGEGRLDRSTLMGKGGGELAARCRQFGVPCIALGGSVSDQAWLSDRFWFAGALTDLTSTAQAQANAGWWLEQLAADVARQAFPEPG